MADPLPHEAGTPPPPPLECTRVGNYLLQRRIGVGGWGEVFEAVQPEINKRVAVKILLRERAGNPEWLDLLMREARAVNAVRHPGVVDIFDAGLLPDGRPYLVMEYLDGEALDVWLEVPGLRPLGQVLTVLRGILEALGAVHRAGVLHRDLKPSNIFLVADPSGQARVKLLDFGLAGRAAMEQDEVKSHVMGTPSHMALQQLEGFPATVASDLYAVGVIAFRALTGDVPFGRVPTEVADAQRAGPPAKLQLIAPKGLRRWVGQLLALEPTSRPASAEAALARLLSITRFDDDGTRPKRSFWARTFTRAAAAERIDGTALVRRAEATPEAPGASPPPPPLRLVQVLQAEPAGISVPAEMTEQLLALCELRLARLELLPPFPAAAARVMDLLRRGMSEVPELVRLVNQDPALIARVLRLANSAASSRGIEIKTVRDAVTRLGMREIASAVAAQASSALFERRPAHHAAVAQAQRSVGIEALTTALGASALAMQRRDLRGDEVFVAGLLHDIGKILALEIMDEPSSRSHFAEFDMESGLLPLVESVHEVVGAHMAEAWQLPAEVVRACREHHHPSPGAPPVLQCVRLASALAEMAVNPAYPASRLGELEESAAELGLDAHQLRVTTSEIRGLAAKATALFSA